MRFFCFAAKERDALSAGNFSRCSSAVLDGSPQAEGLDGGLEPVRGVRHDMASLTRYVRRRRQESTPSPTPVDDLMVYLYASAGFGRQHFGDIYNAAEYQRYDGV